MSRVILVSMPFVGLERPSIGLGLLQPLLRQRGHTCDVKYMTIGFAEFLGLGEYQWVADDLPYTAFIGDWLFAEALYGPDPERDTGYLDKVLRGYWHLDQASLRRLRRIRTACELFLASCAAQMPWDSYDVVGFTSTFTQNVASLALAQRLKSTHPNLVTVFGGANWEGEMGQALHAEFSFVDYVCSGEADDSLPKLVDWLEGSDGSPCRVAGVIHRDGGASVANKAAPLVTRVDELPTPDYDDYYSDLQNSSMASAVTPRLLIETSRGCWWGAKSHCTFCGLNGETMAFRRKNPERVLAEINEITHRYGVNVLDAVDDILDISFFKTVLPSLARRQPKVHIFYEIKANLSLEKIQLLKASGIDVIQPGIESLSDHVLELMCKGTTALQNIQLLKWCRELGVRVEWNMLYGFPGEERADYEAMVPLLHAIWFLRPPSGDGPVRMDRFSPYHNDPAAFGMVHVRPMMPYRYIYRFDDATLSRAVCYFDFDYADGRDAAEHAEPIVELLRQWQADKARGTLLVRTRPGSILLADTRRGFSRRNRVLRGWRAKLYLQCDRAQSERSLMRDFAGANTAEEDIADFLRWCVEEGLMVSIGGKYLSLALHSPPRAWRDPEARIAQPAHSEAIAI